MKLSKKYLQRFLTHRSGKLIWNHRPFSDFMTRNACRAWNTKYKGKEAGYFLQQRGCRVVAVPVIVNGYKTQTVKSTATIIKIIS